jgi:hypothetical protein
MKSVIQQAKRLIVKVGSSLVTNDGKGLDHAAIAKWAEQIAQLRALGKQVVLVSSGAIAEGMQRLGFDKRPTSIHELQACAAVGQMGLAQIYESSFRHHNLRTAQVLTRIAGVCRCRPDGLGADLREQFSAPQLTHRTSLADTRGLGGSRALLECAFDLVCVAEHGCGADHQ